MTITISMQPPQLPSFQSFLASARASSPVPFAQVYYPSSPIVYKHKPFVQDEYVHSRMYQLASLTAFEYEKALRSSHSGNSSPTDSVSSYSERFSTTSSDESETYSDEEPLARVSPTTSPTRTQLPAVNRNKKKYLKEKQRCEIVRRVRAGEKQAHLAKEFGVSRAAVCYLLKHQDEILSRSGDAA